MGIIKQGILGGFSKKVGSVVGSSWKGINTMRSLPVSVRNPRTTAQQANRSSFASYSKLGSQILTGAIQPLFNRWAKQKSGYNEWVRINKNLYDKDGFQAAMMGMVIAQGELSTPEIASATYDSDGLATITYDKTLVNPHDKLDDDVFVVLAVLNNPATTLDDVKLVAFPKAGEREDETLSFQIPDFDGSLIYNVYIATRAKDGMYRGVTSASPLLSE